MKAPLHICLGICTTLTSLLLHPSDAHAFGAGSDSFASATSVNTGTARHSDPTNLTTFTEEEYEPSHRADTVPAARHTAWWTYTAPESGFCTIDTLRSGSHQNGLLNTTLAVYTGTSVDNLNPIAKNSKYGDSNFHTVENLSRVTFYAQKDTTYKIAADGYLSNSITATRYNVILSVRLMPLRPQVRAAAFGLTENVETLGLIQLTATGKSTFSGKLSYGTAVYPIKGTFGTDGKAYISIERKAPPGTLPLPPITLELDGTLGGYYHLDVPGTASVTDQLLQKAAYTKINPTNLPAYYTGFATLNSGTAYGFISAKVSPTGLVNTVCTISDGTAVTVAGDLYKLDANREAVPVFKLLHGKKGALGRGNITFNTSSLSMSSFSILYIRPAKPGALFYPAGINTLYTITGYPYPKPAANTRAHGFLDPLGEGTLKIKEESLEFGGNGDLIEPLTLSTKNTFTFASTTRKPTLKLNPTTGLVTGSIAGPISKKHNLKGMLVKSVSTPRILGYATGTRENMPLDIRE